ncbi:MAG: GNAT family N-acetyltransferase [Alphaproteobacteria bacterium]|nr:GNAT family N-acetyltransferase [Alphaproteobacteria bacterium]
MSIPAIPDTPARPPAPIRITRGYAPGALGRVVELHGLYYSRAWGFGPQFEAEVATELAEFLGRYDPARDGFWLAWQDGRIMASVTLDHRPVDGETGARVRWFVADAAARGTGVGGRLFDALLAFAAATGQTGLYLWTFEGLTAARRLYDRAGFRLTASEAFADWGPTVTAQRMQRGP